LKELLQVNSIDSLKLLVDDDEDGLWNEDDQILIFTLIKEYMQTMANRLCDIYEYGAYKRLSDALRSLEANILKY
jgi:hypothetical protein